MELRDLNLFKTYRNIKILFSKPSVGNKYFPIVLIFYTLFGSTLMK